MEGDNFVLPGTDRVPSLFAASCMFFAAVAGKPVMELADSLLLQALPGLESGMPGSLFYSVRSIAYFVLFLLLPFTVYAKRKPGISEYIRVRPLSGKNTLLVSLMAAVGFMLSLYAGGLWCAGIEALGGRLTPSNSYAINGAGSALAQLLAVVIMPAVCEELLFRGSMLSAWEERGSFRAVLIVAVLFTMLHASLKGLPAQLISGIALGCAVVYTDSLFAGMLYHIIHNSLTLIMSRIASGGESSQTYFEAAGGTRGIILYALYAVLFALCLVYLIKRLRANNPAHAHGRRAIKGRDGSVHENVVIGCGVIVALALCVRDLLAIMGVTG